MRLSKGNRKCTCDFRILTLVLEGVKLLTHIERVRNGTYISFRKMDLSIVGDFIVASEMVKESEELAGRVYYEMSAGMPTEDRGNEED